MPLKFQFKKFFEKDELLEKTLNRIQLLRRTNKLTNFVQGKLWEAKANRYQKNLQHISYAAI